MLAAPTHHVLATQPADLKQWVQQWVRLAKQEEGLAAACPEGAGAGDAHAATAGGCTQHEGTAASVQHVRTHLSRHLAVAQPLLAAAASWPLPPSLERRRQQCAASLTALEGSNREQLQALAEAEAEAAAGFDKASEHVRQLLAAPAFRSTDDTSSPSETREGSSTSRSAQQQAAADDSRPPEVAAHDAFLQRHGRTGASMWRNPTCPPGFTTRMLMTSGRGTCLSAMTKTQGCYHEGKSHLCCYAWVLLPCRRLAPR
jgi:hypothetical protein